jgi:hypothetical protein
MSLLRPFLYDVDIIQEYRTLSEAGFLQDASRFLGHSHLLSLPV